MSGYIHKYIRTYYYNHHHCHYNDHNHRRRCCHHHIHSRSVHFGLTVISIVTILLQVVVTILIGWEFRKAVYNSGFLFVFWLVYAICYSVMVYNYTTLHKASIDLQFVAFLCLSSASILKLFFDSIVVLFFHVRSFFDEALHKCTISVLITTGVCESICQHQSNVAILNL